MGADELDYLEQRAEAEIALAQNADDSRVAKAHYDLANHYLDRIHGAEAPGA